MATAISNTRTNGFNISDDICFTTNAPKKEPIRVKGKSLDTSEKFTFPDLTNEIVLVKAPIVLANLLVAMAAEGAIL